MKHFFLFTLIVVLTIPTIFAQQSQVFETRTLRSNILNMDRRYAIYLPPGYEQSDRSYPVLYLLHGSGDNHTGWVQFGQVQHITDKVIAEGKATEMIIVMPDADAPASTGRRGYFNDIRGGFDYENFFFEELIPHIEKTYRCRTEKRYRAISGLSMGGGGTIFYTLHRPDLFVAACPMSAATGPATYEELKERRMLSALQPQTQSISEDKIRAYYQRHNIAEAINVMNKETLDELKKVRWYITCGDDDFLYKGNALLHVLFREKQISHEYRVKDGGHTWTYWRMELPIVLEFISKSFIQH